MSYNAKLTRPAPDEIASTDGPSPARVERLDGQTGSRETFPNYLKGG